MACRQERKEWASEPVDLGAELLIPPPFNPKTSVAAGNRW
jgi:hypothetical protein